VCGCQLFIRSLCVLCFSWSFHSSSPRLHHTYRMDSFFILFCTRTMQCLLLNYFHNYHDRPTQSERPLWKTAIQNFTFCLLRWGIDPGTPTLSFVVLCFRASTSQDKKRWLPGPGQGYSTSTHLVTSEFSSGLEPVRKKRRKGNQ